MTNSKEDDICIVLQDKITATFFLHDTVYLYLRTVNQTVAEANSDLFRDGRYIRNKTIGQRFTGWFPTPIDLFSDKVTMYNSAHFLFKFSSVFMLFKLLRCVAENTKTTCIYK